VTIYNGATAVRDALAEGTPLYPPGGLRSRYAAFAGEWSGVDKVEAWLRYADEDLLAAHSARFPRNAACHAQQAAERALQALIFRLGGEPARIHALPQLLLDIAALDGAIGGRLRSAHENAAAELTLFAVTPR